MKTAMKTYEAFEIHGLNQSGHRLHWDGEKFTDAGQAWNFGSIEEARRERTDNDGIDSVSIYGWTDEEPITRLLFIEYKK